MSIIKCDPHHTLPNNHFSNFDVSLRVAVYTSLLLFKFYKNCYLSLFRDGRSYFLRIEELLFVGTKKKFPATFFLYYK
jgi:hypothetical protein